MYIGLHFCVSGNFTVTQGALKSLIESSGGICLTSVSKACDYVISDAIGSGKTTKAVKEGIPVATEEWVRDSIKQGKLSSIAFLTNSSSSSSPSSSSSSSSSSSGQKRKSKDDEDGEDEDTQPKAKKGKDTSKSSSSVFAGMVFCVSGNFAISQSAMKSLLESNGGSTVSTVNKSCTHVVANEIGSSKTEKAVEEGIPVVSEAWVNTSIKEGKPSTNQSLFTSADDGGEDGNEGGEEYGEDDEDGRRVDERAKLFADMSRDPSLRQQVTSIYSGAALPYLTDYIKKNGNKDGKIPESCRCAWKPKFNKRTNVDITHSKVGGYPFLSSSEEWPRCNKGHALIFIIQLRISEMPKQVQAAFGRKGNDGQVKTDEMIQLFICDEGSCGYEQGGDDMLTSSQCLIRFISVFQQPLPTLLEQSYQIPALPWSPTEQDIVGWELIEEDFPMDADEYGKFFIHTYIYIYIFIRIYTSYYL